MIAVSETWKNSIYEKRKSLKIRAEVSLLTGNTIYLDYDDNEASYQDSFMATGISFADATSNETTFDVGQAVMNSFSFKLNNFDSRFSKVIFENAVITPYVGMELPDGTTEWIKKGVFNISDPGKRGRILSFTAYDNMQKMEMPFASVQITYPIELGAMAQKICDFCGVTLKSTTFRNSTYKITAAPAGSNHSCRQMISYIAQIAGSFARFDANGSLEISWYESDESKYYNLDVYKNLEVNVKDTEITGVKVSSYYNENSTVDENGNPVTENTTIGSDGFVISIQNNPLIPYGKSSEVANLLQGLVGLTFRPLTLTTFYDPVLEAGDTAKITDVEGNSYVFFVTNLTATLGSDVKIVCGSETTEENMASQYTGASQAILAILEATNAKFKDLTADKLEALVGKFGFLKVEDAEIKYATIEKADILQANINEVSGNLASFISGDFENLKAKQASFENATAEKFTAQQADIDEVSGNFASFVSGEFETLKSKEAEFENATAQNFTAVNAQIEIVSGDLADYKVVIAGELVTAKGWMLEGAIGDAQISDLSANKLRSGTIDTAILTIAGSDGHLQIVDNTIQISDANHVRVQIGKDASGDYTLAVWDAEGKLIWDALGATENTIQRAIIRDSMVSDDAGIQALKIDFQSFDTALTEQGVVISGTVIQVGEKMLDVALSEQTQVITEQGETLTDHEARITANEASILLKVSTQEFNSYKTTTDEQLTVINESLSTTNQEISVMQGQIALKVEQTDIDTAIAGVEVGGRQLIPNTNNMSNYAKSPSVTILTDEEGFSVANFAQNTTLAWSGISTKNNINYSKIRNKQVTISFEYRSDDWIASSSASTGGYNYPVISFDITNVSEKDNTREKYRSVYKTSALQPSTEWVKYEYTTVITDDFFTGGTGTVTEDSWLYLHIFNYSLNHLQVRKIKLELGTKATDWTPAPEDIDSSISAVDNKFASYSTTTQMNSAIELAKDEINLSVSQTYATIDNVTGIDTRLSDAEATLTIQAGQIAAKVGADGVVAAINLSPEEFKIQANRIALEGATIADEFTATKIHVTGESTFEGVLNGATGSFSGDILVKSATIVDAINMYPSVSEELEARKAIYFSERERTSSGGITYVSHDLVISNPNTNYTSKDNNVIHRGGQVVIEPGLNVGGVILNGNKITATNAQLSNLLIVDGINFLLGNETITADHANMITATKNYVVEEGSTSGWTNGEWYYRKWASGIIEGWRCMKIETASGWAACGNVYYLDSYSGYPCDGMFESILNVTITPYHSSGHVMGVSQKSWYASSSQTGNKNITFTMYNYTSASLSNVYVNIYVVGKWE